jgi:myosin-1
MTKNRQQFFKLARRVTLDKISSITLSTLQDGFFVIQAEGTDLLMDCANKTELVCVINEHLEATYRLKLNIQFNDNINYTIKQGDSRTVRFQKDESAQQAKVRKDGKSLTVSISSGLDRNTDTTPQGYTLGSYSSSAAARPAMGGAKKAGGAAKAAQPAAKKVAAAAQPGPAKAAAQAGPAKVAAPGVKKAPVKAAAAAAKVPQCKALYDYVAAGDNELSFRAGDLITIIQRDPVGWWEGELNGRRGWIPANYVQEV